jgi:HTH-type transcriptional regulator/antitoxin HipB
LLWTGEGLSGVKIDNWSKFGAAIRDARVTRGFTQASLAERAGISRAWLARFEGGHRRAELEQVLRVLAALDMWISIEGVVRLPGEAAVVEAVALKKRTV